MHLCVCSRSLSFFFPSRLECSLGTSFGPQMCPHVHATRRTAGSLTCFYSLKLLIRAAICFAISSQLTLLCIVLIGTRRAADVRSAALLPASGTFLSASIWRGADCMFVSAASSESVFKMTHSNAGNYRNPLRFFQNFISSCVQHTWNPAERCRGVD